MPNFTPQVVIPAKAGIHFSAGKILPAWRNRRACLQGLETSPTMDPGLRRDDD
jgi:hypothetical protein